MSRDAFAITKAYRVDEVPHIIRNSAPLDALVNRWTDEYLSNRLGKEKLNATLLRHYTPFTKNDEGKANIKVDYATFKKISDDPKALRYYLTLPRNESSWVTQETDFTRQPGPFWDNDVPGGMYSWTCRVGAKGLMYPAHFDGARAMLMLVRGVRRIILVAPEECPNLDLATTTDAKDVDLKGARRHSLMDWKLPESVKELKRRGAKVVQLVLKAGEAVFVPPYWTHFLVSLEETILCNQFFGMTKKSVPIMEKCGFPEHELWKSNETEVTTSSAPTQAQSTTQQDQKIAPAAQKRTAPKIRRNADLHRKNQAKVQLKNTQRAAKLQVSSKQGTSNAQQTLAQRAASDLNKPVASVQKPLTVRRNSDIHRRREDAAVGVSSEAPEMDPSFKPLNWDDTVDDHSGSGVDDDSVSDSGDDSDGSGALPGYDSDHPMDDGDDSDASGGSDSGSDSSGSTDGDDDDSGPGIDGSDSNSSDDGDDSDGSGGSDSGSDSSSTDGDDDDSGPGIDGSDSSASDDGDDSDGSGGSDSGSDSTSSDMGDDSDNDGGSDSGVDAVTCAEKNRADGAAGKCGPCLDGFFTDGTDAVGGAAPDSSSMCSGECSDLYRFGGGTTGECGVCMPGFDGETSGNEACTCQAGWVISNGACTECPADTYSSEENSDTCTACDLGSNTNELTGQTACEYCEAGYTRVDDSCEPCEADTFKADPGNHECSPCAEASETTDELTGQTSCMCAAGYFPDGSGCSPCPKDTFKAAAGSGSCLPCGLGESTDDEASTVCTPCTAFNLLPAIAGVQTLDFRTSNELAVRVEKCVLAESETRDPVFFWSLVSQSPESPAFDESWLDGADAPLLLLPEYSLAPDTTYTFMLTASLDESTSDSASLTIKTLPAPVIARLAPLGISNNVHAPLWLDASATEGELPDEPLLFTYTCHVGAVDGPVCAGLELPVDTEEYYALVPADSLEPGTYFFTVRASRGDVVSEASASTVFDTTTSEVSLLLNVANMPAASTSGDTQQVTLNGDSRLDLVLYPSSSKEGVFTYDCQATPALEGFEVFPVETPEDFYTLNLNTARDLYFTESSYRVECTVAQNEALSPSIFLSIVVRPPPVVSLTVTPPTGTVTSLTPVELVASGDVATVQFSFLSATTGQTVALSPVTSKKRLSAYLPAGTKTVAARMRNAAGSLAEVSYDLPFAVEAVDPAAAVSQLDQEMEKAMDAYVKAQLVVAFAGAASQSTDPAVQRQATVRALQSLLTVANSLPAEDLSAVLHQVVTGPGMTSGSVDTALQLVRSLTTTVTRSDVTSSTTAVRKAAQVITDLIALFSRPATVSSPRLQLQRRSSSVHLQAVEGGTVSQVNDLLTSLVTVMNAPAPSTTASARPEGSSFTVSNTSSLISTLTLVRNPTTLREVSASVAGTTGTYLLPVSATGAAPLPGLSYLVGLVLASPNPYTGLAPNTLLSSAFIPELQSTAGVRVTSLPAGGAVRLPASSVPAPGQQAACGFLSLSPAATSFAYYANVSSSDSRGYVCPTTSALGVYSLLSVPAPAPSLPGTPAPSPSAVTGASFAGEDDRLRIGLGLGLGLGLPLVALVITAVWCLCQPTRGKTVAYTYMHGTELSFVNGGMVASV